MSINVLFFKFEKLLPYCLENFSSSDCDYHLLLQGENRSTLVNDKVYRVTRDRPAHFREKLPGLNCSSEFSCFDLLKFLKHMCCVNNMFIFIVRYMCHQVEKYKQIYN